MNNLVKYLKENLFKNKRNLIIFIIVLIVISLSLLILFNGRIFSLIGSDGKKIENNYEKLNDVFLEKEKKYPKVDISENNKFKYTSINKIIDVFDNKEDGVIFFGYASCLYCRTAIQILYDTAKNTEINEILYLDVENKPFGYKKLLDILDDKFIDTEDGKKKIYSPLVLFVVDGKVVSHHKGTLFSQYTPYDALDQSQIDGLSQIYEYGIDDVISGLSNN